VDSVVKLFQDPVRIFGWLKLISYEKNPDLTHDLHFRIPISLLGQSIFLSKSTQKESEQ
jgi:hypothetical protein